ncbi:MAG TPA: DUF3010 family protein [Pseudomonas xinjiangensis]|uniref:DUF3010 family protein n=1 Tax=Halopseudomonas xinjiangensis TaxID=487184 RepID=A0A7V1FQQ4_9GAMM|nr:DUF3010 family protein [Halopseudomonas xinjiangensis]HEC47792.1 DUF3010 family protein [Halopseudomonas xinjiangensis]
MKESLKRNPIQIEYTDTDLKVYQEVAFNTAYAYLMKDKYAAKEE